MVADASQERSRRRPWTWVLLLGVLVLAGYGQYRTWSLAILVSPEDGARGVGMDYYQFRILPRAVRAGGVDDFYNRATRKRIGKFSMDSARREGSSSVERRAARLNKQFYEGGMGAAGTPFFYTVFGTFQSNDYDRDLRNFRLTCLAISELTILLLCVGLSYSLLRTLAVMAVFGEWFRPFAGLFEVTNVNHLQLGLVGACAFGARFLGPRLGPALAGTVLGFALMFKPSPIFAAALFYLVFLARRDFAGFVAATVAGAVSTVAAFVLSCLYFGGTDCWWNWLNRTSRALQSFSEWNKAPVVWIQKWTGWGVERYLLGGMMLLAAILILRRQCMMRSTDASPLHNTQRTVLALGLGLAIPLVGFRVVWDHHYTLAIPLILYLFRPAMAGGWRWRQVLTGVAVGLLFGFPQKLSLKISGATDMLLLATAGTLLLVLAFRDLARPHATVGEEVAA